MVTGSIQESRAFFCIVLKLSWKNICSFHLQLLVPFISMKPSGPLLPTRRELHLGRRNGFGQNLANHRVLDPGHPRPQPCKRPPPRDRALVGPHQLGYGVPPLLASAPDRAAALGGREGARAAEAGSAGRRDRLRRGMIRSMKIQFLNTIRLNEYG